VACFAADRQATRHDPGVDRPRERKGKKYVVGATNPLLQRSLSTPKELVTASAKAGQEGGETNVSLV
jgi:hypothetical protein